MPKSAPPGPMLVQAGWPQALLSRAHLRRLAAEVEAAHLPVVDLPRLVRRQRAVRHALPCARTPGQHARDRDQSTRAHQRSGGRPPDHRAERPPTRGAAAALDEVAVAQDEAQGGVGGAGAARLAMLGGGGAQELAARAPAPAPPPPGAPASPRAPPPPPPPAALPAARGSALLAPSPNQDPAPACTTTPRCDAMRRDATRRDGQRPTHAMHPQKQALGLSPGPVTTPAAAAAAKLGINISIIGRGPRPRAPSSSR
eukprot:scaffold2515_cov257-Prasinococcus_capsulatus_cf.AAC.2